jgi:hypothetical protein
MSPQVGKGFNRDYWARFEKFVKDLTKRADEVLVATGPLYLPARDAQGGWQARHQLIGAGGGHQLGGQPPELPACLRFCGRSRPAPGNSLPPRPRRHAAAAHGSAHPLLQGAAAAWRWPAGLLLLCLCC